MREFLRLARLRRAFLAAILVSSLVALETFAQIPEAPGDEGVAPRDEIRAYEWFDLAARSGNSEAAKARADVGSQMTPQQIAEAERRANEWRGIVAKPRLAEPGAPEEL